MVAKKVSPSTTTNVPADVWCNADEKALLRTETIINKE